MRRSAACSCASRSIMVWCVSVRDRRGHKFGEGGQPAQGIGFGMVFVAVRHDHRTPDTTADDHGNACRLADAELPHWLADGAADVRVVIDSQWSAHPLQRGDQARIVGRARPRPADVSEHLARAGITVARPSRS